MPADPFEAELLGMAAALAGDDGDSSSSSEEEFEESLPGKSQFVFVPNGKLILI